MCLAHESMDRNNNTEVYYRVESSREAADKLLQQPTSAKLTELFALDQLTQEMALGGAFSSFHEHCHDGIPPFAPTYKFDVNSDTYAPAYSSCLARLFDHFIHTMVGLLPITRSIASSPAVLFGLAYQLGRPNKFLFSLLPITRSRQWPIVS